MAAREVIYSSRRRRRQQLRDLWTYRELIRTMVVRDLKIRYKNSVLGILWSLLNPLIIMAVFTFVFTVMQPNNQIEHFPIFVLSGLLPWNFFTSALVGGASEIVKNGSLIKKVYFPREVLPISAVLSAFINFLLGLIPLALFLVVSGIGFTPMLLWLPVIFAIQIVFLLGLAFLFSALSVFYRDVLMVLDLATLGLFFLTPIFYPMELIQKSATIGAIVIPVQRLVRWFNPMASIVDAYRTVIYGIVYYQRAADGTILEVGRFAPAAPDPGFLLRTGLTALLVLLAGWLVFHHLSPSFGEEV